MKEKQWMKSQQNGGEKFSGEIMLIHMDSN